MGNQIKTVLLLGALTGFFILIGGMAGGRQGIVIAFILAVVMNFFSYWFSDKIVLAMYKAKEVTEAQAPDLYRIVANLTQKAGMPMPKVYIIPGQSPNAFATGRNPAHAAVAVTEGMLKLANSAELEGVLAHELTHVKNRDTLICAIAATVAGAIMVLASMARWSAIFGGFGGRGDNRQGNNIIGLLFMAILAPFAAMLIQMAISRSREYLADDGAADLTGNPNGLASALGKLASYSQRIPLDANPSTAHMFIVNPLSAQRISRFFSTHPPIEERIERLRKKTGMSA
ncbi:MAG: zinc metalloprotease HtpX [Proteobacteria bacterium]|nr:zinc metalloprotease HtpX [Pseudomonadota bacterium]